jgi:hypothetical protein
MLTGKERRDAFRAALRQADSWDDYRREHNLDMGTMPMSAYQDAFNHCYPDWTIEQWAESHGFEPVKESTIPTPASLFTPTNSAANHVREPAIVPQPTPVTMPESTGIDAATLEIARAIANLGNRSTPIDENAVIEIVRKHAGESSAALSARIDDILKVVEELSVPTRVVIVDKGTEMPVAGLVHKMFPVLLRAAKARSVNGFPANVWLAGPTGSSKTTSARKLAAALNLPFYTHGSASMAFEYVGFVDAGGTYHTTGLRQAWEHGGVVLIDECDGSDNAALLAINPMCADTIAVFPDSPVPVARHPDCVIIAAGNTWGNGATAEFIGRAKIDAAFLSRFPVKLAWDYDSDLEIAMCGNASWARRVQRARDNARSAGIKVVIDPRHSIFGAALIAAGFSPDEAARMTYLASLSPEVARQIE